MGTATGFRILGRALAVVGLRGDIKRGIICSGTGGVKAICIYLFGREGERKSKRERERGHTSAVRSVSIKKKGLDCIEHF